MSGYRPLGTGSAGGGAGAFGTSHGVGYWAPLTPVIARTASSYLSPRMYLTRAFFPEAVTIDRLAVEVTTAGTTVRLGLYIDADGEPGALVAGSEVSLDTSATGVVEATVDLTLVPSIYWVSVVPQTSSTSMRGSSTSGGFTMQTTTAALALGTSAILAARAAGDNFTGALPDPFAGTLITDQTSFPLVAARFA